MERQSRHRLNCRQVDLDKPVVLRALGYSELLISLTSPVSLVPGFHGIVRLPDRREAGGLRRHNVDAHSVVHRQGRDARAREFDHLVLDEAFIVDGAAEGDCDVLRTDSVAGLARKPAEYDLRLLYIVGILKKLTDDLGSALSDAHRAESAVPRVAVASEDHSAAESKLLSRVLVDDRKVGRNVDTAVFLRGGKAENVVVLVYSSADCAEAVVAVRENVRDGKTLKPRCASRLDYSDVGYIVGNKAVKSYPQPSLFI